MEQTLPRYTKIAHDICSKIISGEFKEGDILKGRSLLASTYNVSPETIRKAITILSDEGILEVKHGVGVFVESLSKAEAYADKWAAKNTVNKQYHKINELIVKSRQLNDELKKALEEMTDNFKYQINESISFKKVKITDDCWLIDKTVGEVYFYNYTEATIVAISDGGQMFVSVGPDFVFKAGQILILVGKDNLTFDRVLRFVNYGIEE